MEIDFSQALTAFDGTPLRQPGPDGGEPIEITLRLVAIEALCRPSDERNLTGTEKFARWQLAQRIHNDDVVDLAAEDIAKLKDRIGQLFPPLVVGSSFGLLD